METNKNVVVIRSNDMYWNDIVIRGLDLKMSKTTIKNNLLECFRKEMSSLLVIRTGSADIDSVQSTPENIKKAENIIAQTQRKWNSLVKRCNKYNETKGIISEGDLCKIVETREKH